MDEELRVGWTNWSEGCDGSVHFQNLWMEQSATQNTSTRNLCSRFFGGVHWLLQLVSVARRIFFKQLNGALIDPDGFF